MKKTYQKPSTTIVALNADTQLMAASTYMEFGDSAEEGEIGEAKATDSPSLWDEEEDF